MPPLTGWRIDSRDTPHQAIATAHDDPPPETDAAKVKREAIAHVRGAAVSPAIGLGLINAKVVQILAIVKDHRHFLSVFAIVMGIATLLVTLLHAIEAGIWAGAYRALGAIADNKSAILYSLSAMSTYGHADLHLGAHWQLMGALEALNGMILFGLTTAFLYGMIHRVWPVENRKWHPSMAAWSWQKSVPKGS
jgi:hypothetical protein